MKSIFNTGEFKFPYTHLKFPGQASDEKILYVTREAGVMLQLRLLPILLAGLVMAGMAVVIPNNMGGLEVWIVDLIRLALVIFGFVFVVVGSWWVWSLWRKSLFILSNRRLTKFIYSTPWNRYNLSLSLDKIVDTGAYAKGYLQALFKIGTFSARSSAGNRKDKYFYIENVTAVEDLASYVNKLLYVFQHQHARLDSFRPFIVHLKGEARKRFMKDYPQYWS
jgi:hypothetical protein